MSKKETLEQTREKIGSQIEKMGSNFFDFHDKTADYFFSGGSLPSDDVPFAWAISVGWAALGLLVFLVVVAFFLTFTGLPEVEVEERKPSLYSSKLIGWNLVVFWLGVTLAMSGLFMAYGMDLSKPLKLAVSIVVFFSGFFLVWWIIKKIDPSQNQPKEEILPVQVETETNSTIKIKGTPGSDVFNRSPGKRDG
jgi:hypothetical protein